MRTRPGLGGGGGAQVIRLAYSKSNMDGPFLTVDEISKLLKVNAQTVRNWIDAGELPAVRVGSRRVRAST